MLTPENTERGYKEVYTLTDPLGSNLKDAPRNRIGVQRRSSQLEAR
jgi:hypothetical protein